VPIQKLKRARIGFQFGPPQAGFDEPRHAAGFHILIVCIEAFNNPHKPARLA
jgi:hypothetical protein